MKRIISFVISIFLIALCVGCGKTATTQSGKVEKESTAICVAMNPVISFKGGKKINAFENVYACMENDYNADEYSLNRETNWRWMYYDESEKVWSERGAIVATWQNGKLENQKKTPFAYSFSDDGITSLTPYDMSNVRVLPYVLDTAPEQGLILSVSRKEEEGLCYLVPEDGEISIFDPSKGQISIIRRIEDTQTYSLDNDKIMRGARIIIYQNGKPLWATEFGNPKYYSSTNESDGVYAVPFPSLENIKVKSGDLISIVVQNETDLRTVKELVPKKTKKYVEVSTIKNDSIKNYLSVGDKPCLLNAVQLRLDIAKDTYSAFTRDKQDEYLEPFFKQAADIGYETVIIPVRWKDIEVKKNAYTFEELKLFYEYLKKYDLKVQWLWFGSDVCGFSTDIPSYILSDKQKYSRLKKYPEVLNYGDIDLVEKELKAFNKFMEFLATYDREHRAIMIQIENEPNAFASKGPSLRDFNDADYVNSSIWVAGQYQEIKELINALGMCVKNGPYRCVTRVNFMTYDCMYNGLNNWQVKEICDLDGIDIVGFDSYDTSTDIYLMKHLDFENNISHFPEYGANHSNTVPKILKCLSERSGIFSYQLKSSGKNPTGAIFADDDNVWNLSHGEAVINKSGAISHYQVDTVELKAMNLALLKSGDKIALNDPTKTNVFNSNRMVNCNESISINGIGIGFSNRGAANFGGCGYITAVGEKEFIFFATRGSSTFTFGGTVISVSKGRFDANGKWKTESELAVGKTIDIDSKSAEEGTLYRVVMN